MEAFVIGAGVTPFGRHVNRGYADLAREAVLAALTDAQIEGQRVGLICFGSCAMGAVGQTTIRGQAALTPLLDEQLLDATTPITNVDAACATGGVAFATAVQAVRSGVCDVALAVGVDKPFMPSDLPAMAQLYEGALDQLDAARWRSIYERAAAAVGTDFSPTAGRITLLDVCALQALGYRHQYGLEADALAAVAAKNRQNGALNPNALCQAPKSPAEVLADKVILSPLTRAMCAPIADGAAAVVVATEAAAAATAKRAARVRAAVSTGGLRRSFDEPTVAEHAAARLYQAAGLGPDVVDFAELHDATALSEITQTEAFGFCAPGTGGAFALSGNTARDGALPVNLSGGLIAKGHPIAATGLAMIAELLTQLRGEAGPRQAPRARRGLAYNAGGLNGLTEAVATATILEGAESVSR